MPTLWNPNPLFSMLNPHFQPVMWYRQKAIYKFISTPYCHRRCIPGNVETYSSSWRNKGGQRVLGKHCTRLLHFITMFHKKSQAYYFVLQEFMVWGRFLIHLNVSGINSCYVLQMCFILHLLNICTSFCNKENHTYRKDLSMDKFSSSSTLLAKYT